MKRDIYLSFVDIGWWNIFDIVFSFLYCIDWHRRQLNLWISFVHLLWMTHFRKLCIEGHWGEKNIKPILIIMNIVVMCICILKCLHLFKNITKFFIFNWFSWVDNILIISHWLVIQNMKERQDCELCFKMCSKRL